jgi:hemoglobin
MVRPSLYEFAGGDEAFLALARAHHERCVADPLLNHPFTKEDLNPHHVARLAAYWAEVLGGPHRFSEQLSDHSSMLRLHAGNGPGMLELGPRFVACFVAAADDAGLPADPEFRAALRAYMEWAVADVNEFHDEGASVPSGFGMPRWDWDGLVTSGRT